MYINPYNGYNNGYNPYQDKSAVYNSLFNTKKSAFGNSGGLFGAKDSGFLSSIVDFQAGVQMNKERLMFANSLSSAAHTLRSTLSGLNAALSRPIMQTALSGDKDVLTASSAPIAQAVKRNPLNVSVEQLATGQKTSSLALTGSETFGKGTLAFDITAGGKTKSFSVDIGENDSNSTALGKMALAINDAKIGLDARVVNSKGKSTLVVESQKTGEGDAGKFEISNLKLDGEDKTALIGLGADQTEKGKDAVYSVDGQEYTSDSNKVSLGGGVSAVLKGTGETQISFAKDTSAVVAAVDNFIKAYNGLNSLVEENADKFKGAAALNRDLDKLMSDSWRTLGYAGISMDSKGALSASPESIEKGISEGGLKSMFGDYVSTGNQLSQKLGKVISNPSSFAVQTNQFKFYSSAGSYSSFFSMLNGSAYGDLSSGSLFDAML